MTKKKEIKEDLISKHFWWKDRLTDLDSWIAFYYQDGRFPGSEKLTNVLQVDKPIFLRTETFCHLQIYIKHLLEQMQKD